MLAGKNRGATGRVLRIVDHGTRVVVEGVHLVKKTLRRNAENGDNGGFRTKEAPIDISNVAILNPETGKADRVGFKVDESGKKIRYFKSNGMPIEVAAAA